jgi:hypothetical protein
MAEEWIRQTDGTGIFRISIDEQKIRAILQPIGVVITVPVSWEPNAELRQSGYRWDFISGNAIIKWATKPDAYLAVSLPTYQIEGRKPQHLDFVLNTIQAESLETWRGGGDAKLTLTTFFQFVLEADVNMQRKDMGYNSLQHLQVRSYSASTTLAINIPKSVYEQNILPELGIEGINSLIIMIPPSCRSLIAPALKELDDAEKTLRTAATEAQFESVVLQCRNAINALLNQFHFELPKRSDGNPDASFSKRVDAFVGQYLKDTLSSSQAKSVGSILNALWQPYSAAAKPGPEHHSKAYATFAL